VRVLLDEQLPRQLAPEYIRREMNKTRRARKGPLTVDEFAEYMAIKTMERLSTMPPDEREARLTAFGKIIAEVRAKRGRKPRSRGSRVPNRSR
jgi:hypothetical protein